MLSGRSLEPDHKKSRWEFVSEHRGAFIAAVSVVVILAGLGVAKLVAERAADSATSDQAAEISEILRGSTPRDFLAFNSGVKKPGSVAAKIRGQDGFVNIKAAADYATLRFQPEGWWSGFTERCIVVTVREDKVAVTVPKVACVRVKPPGS